MATQLTIQGQAVRWTERIGQGATSSVWRGEWAEGACVLKLAKGPAEARRFADEAERLLFAAAPEFPALLALGVAGPALGVELGQRVDTGTPYLVLSSAPGVSLAQLLGDPGVGGVARCLTHHRFSNGACANVGAEIDRGAALLKVGEVLAE